MGDWPNGILLSQADVNLLLLSNRLSLRILDAVELLRTSLPADDRLSYQIRSKLLLRGSTLLNAPRPIGRWSPRRFSPYWLKEALIEDYDSMRSQLDLPPTALQALDECVSLDQSIRKVLAGSSLDEPVQSSGEAQLGNKLLEHLLCAISGASLLFAIATPSVLPAAAIIALYGVSLGCAILAYQLSLRR